MCTNSQQRRLPRTGRWLGLLGLLMGVGGCVMPATSGTSARAWQGGYDLEPTLGASAGDERAFLSVQPRRCADIRHDARGARAPLPLGCANDLNLQSMVARPEDLLRGQPMGPARAAPIARAAQAEIERSQTRADQRRATLRSDNAANTQGLTSLPVSP